MATSRQIFIRVIALMFAVQSCGAIKCYYCSSASNSACYDVHLYGEYSQIPLVDCELSAPAHDGDIRFFCRKIIQTILSGYDNRQPEVRVTRGCGWIPHHTGCYHADSLDHTETVCQCFTDSCNSSQRQQSAILFVVTAVLAGMAILNVLFFNGL